MTTFVRIILFLLVSFAFYVNDSHLSSTEQSDGLESPITSHIPSEGQVCNLLDIPFLPVAELTNIHSCHVMTSRVMRVQMEEYLFSMREVLHCRAGYASSQSRHLERIYNTTISYYCQPASAYYIFTLKRILI